MRHVSSKKPPATYMLKLAITIPNDGFMEWIMIFSGLSTYLEVNKKRGRRGP